MPDADDLVVTPDTQDNYVGDEVNLSFGGRCAIGPAICSKIIKFNVQIINLSSYWAITEEEIQDPTQKKLRNEFDS